MRLKHIKLAGFKSFVDATKVPFPHQMTCVVGPNGCGKSNVIDAVRWVLGESSAKNLRGDAMTDVIFNGSGARKPVSQASVELVFDNSDGRIQGEYANYAEISVKRLVTRDGRSDYFLNSSKCRRRDITDLFLGTGLGPRSYAIIEQGMISRLIESKPQELRVFIEEAAGISKYKERRRETENRMQHTRDNLERLSDVRDELGSQLEKLQRQAAAARRYKDLKQQERKYKGELQALKWLAHEQQAERLRQTVREHEAELERWIAEQRGSERGSLELREQAAETKAKLDEIQHQFYQLGNEITRTEHQLQSARQQLQQRQQRQQQLQAELEQLNDTCQRDLAQQEELQLQLEQLQPELDEAAVTAEQAQQEFDAHEEAWLQLQNDYQAHITAQQHQRERGQQLQLQQERVADQVQRNQQQQQELQQQQTQLQQELTTIQADAAETGLEDAAAALASSEQHLQELAQQQQQLREERQQTEQDLTQQRQQQQQLMGRQSSLQTLLEASQASDWPQALGGWLAEQRIEHHGQVREAMILDDTWRFAAEQLLGAWLDAYVVATKPSSWPEQLGTRLVVLTADDAPARSLASLMQGPLRHWPWLQQVALVKDAAEAQLKLAEPGWQCALTAAGEMWSAAGYQASQIDAADSQLLQQQELMQLDETLARVATELTQLEQALTLQKGQRQELEASLQQQREHHGQCQAELSTWREKQQWQARQQQELEQKLGALKQRQSELAEQSEELALQQEEIAMQVVAFEAQQHDTQGDEQWQEKREQLQAERGLLRDALQQQQQRLQDKKLQFEQVRSQLQHTQTLLQRLQQQQHQAQEQLQLLADPDTEQQEELEVQALQLEELLLQRERVDEQRREWANKLAEVEQQLHEVSSGAKGVESRIEKARQQLQSTQMELAALQERSRNVLNVLDEMQQPLKPVLEQLPEDADERAWQAEVDRLQSAISRLGAINLAAIEEADTLGERKAYLDQQHEDLSSSLETLDSAIRKIDRETRQRFKTTFDAVNNGLQELFPKVFGGGSAYLELTEDDLLETGVAIMARPPGKKNSTIHLLSGGEKALTALSLVFAIFRLNPAPFCLLDEVDAPLDDANVGRFCRLVEEMSQTVQFIYISHNKVAMEMASHLAGVTMQEPGVSRLVAVDVDEAVALTEAS
ncbi:chromosome segregation protein SMC [Pseudidiomarina sp. 1APR75-33.1]|uniref:chromosome segregation protein SMC n=1 Tax=Pseudidiomarina terrestris TaxID=2820060 RepID=UPI00264F9C04|nr:chromosome segregation protein SMC [Pseudidiomarina sp. 1APR75-33.1]MDN7127659.1 chromosome segregation protein SMC [Pseudidiomarina sp. 1APR75-33.1]